MKLQLLWTIKIWIYIFGQFYWQTTMIVEAVPVDNNQKQDKQQNIPLSFGLELDPPIFPIRNARDSYGNPINNNDKTGNGKKVIEANGYLFEIPSYASGITDIKPPSDELLPPLTSEEQKPNEPENSSVLPFQNNSTTSKPNRDESSNEINDSQQRSKEPTDRIPTQQFPKGKSVGVAERIRPDQEDEPINESNYPTGNSQNDKTSGEGQTPFITNFIPTFQTNQPSDGNNQKSSGFGFGGFSSFAPPSFQTPSLSSNTDKYTGGFGGPSGIFSPSHTNQPTADVNNKNPTAIQPSVNKPSGFGFGGFPSFIPSSSSNSDKFTGSFGGAPGILGEQRKPGYAVQPDGSVKDPDRQYNPHLSSSAHPSPFVPPTTAAVAKPNDIYDKGSENKIDKYTGGFGGPPGILAPYDN